MADQAERNALIRRLQGCADRINAYYPRPIGEPITASEEAVRAEAREIEARLRELNKEETA